MHFIYIYEIDIIGIMKRQGGTKVKSTVLKIMFLINHIAITLYMCFISNTGEDMIIHSFVPILISSFMLFDIAYISSCNIRENKILFLFCALLGLDSWYLILSFETLQITDIAFYILSPIIWYVLLKFIFIFLFQDSGYKFQKSVNYILFIACTCALFGAFGSPKLYAGIYGLQFLINILMFIFIIVYHRKRVIYVLKSEKKYVLLSLALTFLGFFSYFFLTLKIPNHIGNFGVYLPLLIFFFSVHRILFKENNGFPLNSIFSKMQIIIIFLCSVTICGLIIASLGGTFIMLIISINALFVFFSICNIFLEWNLKRGKSQIIKENRYNTSLTKLQQEENLKAEFANFLHDDVLQDLLSIKNMMKKANRQDVQEIITDTLNTLNINIRQQMQDYHPIILRNLTAKENFQNLISSVYAMFPNKNISVSFECSDILFLVEPYNLLIYRLMKELLTNVYKHSGGNKSWIILTQEKDIIELIVSDNGLNDAISLLSVDIKKHKGISSIKEQVQNMYGDMRIFNNTPQGVTIKIVIPMKGDDSYKYFIS